MFNWFRSRSRKQEDEPELPYLGLEFAVLRKVEQALGKRYSDLDVWLSHYTITVEQLDAEQEKITSLRKWATTLSDRPVRNQYLRWLEYYERGLNDAQHELRTRSKEKSQQKYGTRMEKEFEGARLLADRIPSPPK
jgi:hypothetical protein